MRQIDARVRSHILALDADLDTRLQFFNVDFNVGWFQMRGRVELIRLPASGFQFSVN